MHKRTMIVLIEIEGDELPDKHELVTALSFALKDEPGDPYRWGDPTVYENLSDLVADCDEGRNPDLSR
jgi:hypothetical protein